MKNRIQIVFVVLLTFGINIVSAQLFKPTLKATLLSPPNKDIGDVKKVAILDFKNISTEEYKEAGVDLGSKLADYISINLIKEYRGIDDNCYIKGARTDIYKIAEREELQRVLAERNYSFDTLNDEQIMSIGQVLGVDVIIMGNVSYSSTDERKQSSYRNKKGDLIISNSLKRTTSAEARMKLISVATGEVLGQISERAANSDTASGGTPPNLTAVMASNKLAEFACERMAAQFADYIAPFYYSYTFTFEKVKHKELKERVKDANEFIKLGEIDKAYDMFNAIYTVDPYNAELVFNMGILNEIVGNYEKSKELYGVAVNMDPSKEEYVKGLKRANENISLTQKLAEIGITIEPYEFITHKQSELLTERVRIKGSKSKRKIAYSSPSEESSIVGKFPGGIELDLLENLEQDKWILARLPNGGQGYFKSSDVITGK